MLAKKYRLKRKSEFNYIYKKGTSYSTRSFVLLYAKNRNSEPKFGFVVSKKIGNSVERNRAKRRLISAFYPLNKSVKTNYNYIFVARAGIDQIPFSEIERQFKFVLDKNNLLRGE